MGGGPGYIRTPADAAPRPLTAAEAQAIFESLAGMRDVIAFDYLYEGCECRSQVMIEAMADMGIDPGRAWAVSVGRPLVVADPGAPAKAGVRWYDHTAPTVALDVTPAGVRVIDPSLPGAAGPVPLHGWAAAMRARAVEVSAVPMSQAEILELQRTRALAGGQLDAVVFHLRVGVPPIPERGGSGFRIDADPPEGPSAFARSEMKRLLAAKPPGRSRGGGVS